MGLLSEFSEKRAYSFTPPAQQPEPTLNDLLMRVGSDFTLNTLKRQDMEQQVRGIMARPGNSVKTPVSGIRGAIGDGLRSIADRFFTPKPLGPDNIPGYRRIGQ